MFYLRRPTPPITISWNDIQGVDVVAATSVQGATTNIGYSRPLNYQRHHFCVQSIDIDSTKIKPVQRRKGYVGTILWPVSSLCQLPLQQLLKLFSMPAMDYWLGESYPPWPYGIAHWSITLMHVHCTLRVPVQMIWQLVSLGLCCWVSTSIDFGFHRWYFHKARLFIHPTQ